MKEINHLHLVMLCLQAVDGGSINNALLCKFPTGKMQRRERHKILVFQYLYSICFSQIIILTGDMITNPSVRMGQYLLTKICKVSFKCTCTFVYV